MAASASVSVIIPVYNGERFLDEALASVTAQRPGCSRCWPWTTGPAMALPRSSGRHPLVRWCCPA